jgi:type II secretory pathway pseudopilin PulG
MSRLRGSSRRGNALLEVVIGMVILSVAGSAMLLALGQTQRTVRSVREADRLSAGASAELERLVAFDRDALLQREGWSSRGAWSIGITRVSPALFDVVVAQSPGGHAILRTTLYRPDTADEHER